MAHKMIAMVYWVALPSLGKECISPSGWSCDQKCHCWPSSKKGEFDCDSNSDCSKGCHCGNANCGWSSWGSKDDCCICPTYGKCGQPKSYLCNGDCTACYPKSKEGSFDCDSDGDCAAGMTCGNANCAWASGLIATQDDCCIVKAQVACGCNGGGCWPKKGFDCDKDSDCSGQAKMKAMGATTCGNGNCPWTSGVLETQDDCCIKNGCTGESFSHPSETREITIKGGYANVVADIDQVHMEITKIALLTKPTDAFGDFTKLINTQDEITLEIKCGSSRKKSATNLFGECDQWTNVMSSVCPVESDIEMELVEHDTSVNEKAIQILDVGMFLGLPLGSTSRVRFYLDNAENTFDSALLWSADMGLFEVCLSDVLAAVTGTSLLRVAVKAAKALKMSKKSVRRISKAVKAIKQTKTKIRRYEKKYEKNKAKVEFAQAKFFAAEERIVGGESFDPVELPDWPTLDTAMEAFALDPCVDFADGVVYKWTVYEVEVTFNDKTKVKKPQLIDGSKHSSGDEKCPSQAQINAANRRRRSTVSQESDTANRRVNAARIIPAAFAIFAALSIV